MDLLRLARPADDARQVLDIYTPYILNTAATFETQIPSAEDFTGRMEKTLERYPWIVCEDEAGSVAGYAYASRYRERAAYRWDAELSVYVRGEACGRGIASRLYGAIFDILKLQGFYTLFSCVTLPGEKSLALHRKYDFRRMGVLEKAGFKLGRWHDVCWLAKPLRDYDSPGGIPALFSQLAPEEVERILARHNRG